MILHQEMFQSLVDKIIADIGYNINIIDPKGIIIASGSKERIGTFHAIGFEAANKEERVDIVKSDLDKFKGVKEGANQPFYYQGRLVGVIGITGEAKKIDEFVKVVKTMIELMVEQELLKQKMFYRQSNKSYFANLLLNIKTKEDRITLERWASKLGYDISIKRTVLVVMFKEKYADEVHSDIIKCIKSVKGHEKEDFSALIGTNQILILKTNPNNDKMPYFTEYGKRVVKKIEELTGIKAFVGIGSFYTSIEEQFNGFNEAVFSIQQMIKHKDGTRVGCIQDYLLLYMAGMIPKELFEHFLQEYLDQLKDSEELMETLVALSKNHMNLVDTAKSLYVHRNTVVFRLNKIKELTGLDPTHDHRGRMISHLIATYYEAF